MAAGFHGRQVTDLPPRFAARAIAFAAALLAAAPAMAEGAAGASGAPGNVVEFESGFLRALGQSVDLARFERDESVTEGNHPVQVTINDMQYGTQSLPFARNAVTGRIEPCFPKALVDRIGLDPARQPQPAPEGACAFLGQLVEGGSFEHDAGEQKLVVTIPQAFLLYRARGYVPPDALDHGITAASFRYTLSYSNNQNSLGTSGQYLYGGLQSAFNVGAWRFRTYGTLSSNEGQATRWDHVAAYAQRSLPKIQSEATIGDWNTTGALFDSTAVRGFSLATDDRMLPDSLRGYAPVVRGVARSNAVVTVRQGANVIFESNVPPGEFEFRDLYATGYGGDLEVTVTEADGQVQRFAVPYGSIAQLLRADYTKYSVTAGQVRDDSITDAPILLEGTVQHGLTNDVTVYAGAQVTAPTYYAAAMAGIAVNTPMGALGLDLTQSYATCVDVAADCNKTGHSVRASLGKQFSGTGTYFSLVGYRYSSAGYYSLMDALLLREVELGHATRAPQRLRDRFDINVTQTLGPTWGNLFLTGSYGRRWDDNGTSLGFQAGYTNSLGPARYNISLGRTRNALGKDENSVFLSVSLPLGKSAINPASLSLSASHVDGINDLRANVTGNLGENGQASYGAWFDAATGGATSFGGTVGYTGEAVKGNFSYGHTPHTNTVGVNASGGVLVHGDGVNFTSELGDTVALVQADGATGARVLPYRLTTIGEDGTAVVPYITPYQWNNVELDLKGADMGLQVDNTRIVTAPTAGAVVKLKFDSKRTESAVLRLRRADGSLVPFGAIVFLADSATIGTVGGGGTVVATDLPADAKLTARWGDAATQQCVIHYSRQAGTEGAGDQSVPVHDVTCATVTEAATPPGQKEQS